MTRPCKKGPTIQWDCQKRQLLCCLYRFFVRDNSAFESIFSETFRNDLIDRGFGSGNPSYRVLHSQWIWMKSTGNPTWLHVHRDSDFADWSHVIAQIEATAIQQQIQLIHKEEDDIGKSELHNIVLEEKNHLGYLESVLTAVRPLNSVILVLSNQVFLTLDI